MRKNFLNFVLVAAGLLIGTNAWATCKIGTTEYPSVKVAIEGDDDQYAGAPTDGTETVIVMTADELMSNISETVGITIKAGQKITLDLNGCALEGSSSVGSGNVCFIQISKATKEIASPGSLTILDTKAPDNPKEGTGKIVWTWTKNQNLPAEAMTIINNGNLLIKSGVIKFMADYNTVDYMACPGLIDNYLNGCSHDVTCTVENGYLYSSYECFRNATWSTTYSAKLNLIGGIYEALHGIVFDQGGKDCHQTVTITGGNYTSALPLIRVWTDNSGTTISENAYFNITGGISNADALYIQFNAYNADKNNVPQDPAELAQQLDSMIHDFEENYHNMFNFTGGTFKSENYSIKTNIINTGNAEEPYKISDNVEQQYYTLPTLLEGAKYKDEPSNLLPEDQHTESEITIVPVTNNPVTDGSQLDKVDEAATIKQDVTISSGTEATAYNLTVKDNAIVTVADGAILTIGQGGVTVEEGSKIIVEAGGILRIGDRGFEGTGADALIVKTDLNKSGIVSISPSAYLNDAPQLTIQMVSRGYTDAQGNRWQYFAIPTQDASLQIPGGVYTYMYNWDVDAQEWNLLSLKAQVNEPFRGYIMTNSGAAAGNVTYTMQGNMNGRADAVLKLKGDGDAENWNFFGNSYLAPIDIEKFLTSMKSMEGADGAEPTICIYDATTGSYSSITKNDLSKTVIPPMNAFFMNLKNASSANVLLDYSECVYGNEVITAMYAPARQQIKANSMKITVAGETNIDKISFFEGADFSDAFDNDYEASKMMNDGVNIYAELNNSKLAAVANSTLDGTQLHFQADNAVEYTMTISNNNCDGYVLVDNLTNAHVAMTDGATYTFVATPNETSENRFEIRKMVNVVTDLTKVKAAHAVKGIYTAAGQYVGKADKWSTLPAGMYIVDGVRMAK